MWLERNPLIASFGDRLTEDLFHGRRTKRTLRLERSVVSAAVRRLELLEFATALPDLASAPGNRLEALKGDLTGLHSIRVNDRWRLVFKWKAGAAHGVTLADYH
jgi:proteic killer suppression protein